MIHYRAGSRIVRMILLAAALAFAVPAMAQQSPDEFVRETAELLDRALEDRQAELTADREALYALIDEIL